MDTDYSLYYKTYPYYDVFSKKNEEARDIVYLRKMYPKEMCDIQEVVDDECDKMEYDGSLMFDEYPDRLMLERLCKHICSRVGNECQIMEASNDKGIISDLVAVMLCNEMCRRRCRRRNRRYY